MSANPLPPTVFIAPQALRSRIAGGFQRLPSPQCILAELLRTVMSRAASPFTYLEKLRPRGPSIVPHGLAQAERRRLRMTHTGPLRTSVALHDRSCPQAAATVFRRLRILLLLRRNGSMILAAQRRRTQECTPICTDVGGYADVGDPGQRAPAVARRAWPQQPVSGIGAGHNDMGITYTGYLR